MLFKHGLNELKCYLWSPEALLLAQAELAHSKKPSYTFSCLTRTTDDISDDEGLVHLYALSGL